MTLKRIVLGVVAALALIGASGAAQPTAVMASATSKPTVAPLATMGPGYYELRMLQQTGAGYYIWCLDADISRGYLYNGAKVQLWECKDTANQIWYYDGGYLLNQFDPNYCLDVNLTSPAAQNADGHRLLVRPCTDQSNQRWSWNSDFSLQSHWNGKCADANVSTIGDGDPIALWGCVSGKDNQTWYNKNM